MKCGGKERMGNVGHNGQEWVKEMKLTAHGNESGGHDGVGAAIDVDEVQQAGEL